MCPRTSISSIQERERRGLLLEPCQSVNSRPQTALWRKGKTKNVHIYFISHCSDSAENSTRTVNCLPVSLRPFTFRTPVPPLGYFLPCSSALLASSPCGWRGSTKRLQRTPQILDAGFIVRDILSRFHRNKRQKHHSLFNCSGFGKTLPTPAITPAG